ncbi:BQ5605_C040g11848 [Microbotryum silenes-dioicae]|uniref:BQ5605_C040g11848 protein n=1 Tax=Microbotryum silenes-dioicae TaxID=796604 RepID=A0A2X0PIX4_9BASI|nr:BQ5605_C040g11848 [Microbotryum silenes-dioicae]
MMQALFNKGATSIGIQSATPYQGSPNPDHFYEDEVITASARRESHSTHIPIETSYVDKAESEAFMPLQGPERDIHGIKRRRSAAPSLWPLAWSKADRAPKLRRGATSATSYVNRRILSAIVMAIFFVFFVIMVILKDTSRELATAESQSSRGSISGAASTLGDASATGTDRWSDAPGRWKHEVTGWGSKTWLSAQEKFNKANKKLLSSFGHLHGPTAATPATRPDAAQKINMKKVQIEEGSNYVQIFNHDTPQPTLETQLKKGVRYITSIAYGGHANQMISIARQLLLAKLTNRVAIIPTLLPTWWQGGSKDLTDYYDLDRFVADSGIPGVTWSSVKQLTDNVTEDIACWSVHEATVGHGLSFVPSMNMHGMKVTPWALPPLQRGDGGFDLAFDALRIFDYDEGAKSRWLDTVRAQMLPQEPLADGKAIPIDHVEERYKNRKTLFDPRSPVVPTHQMFCLDNTMFVGPLGFQRPDFHDVPLEALVPGEELSWIEAGQHMHFNEALEGPADAALVRLFNVKTISDVPPFITMHMRRGDFKEFLGAFIPLEAYTEALRRLRARLQERIDDPEGFVGPGRKHFKVYPGYSAADYRVVVSTDEASDSDFVKEVKALGWLVVDHEELGTEKLGRWHNQMLDFALLARGQSFVGTPRSTYSHISSARVK